MGHPALYPLLTRWPAGTVSLRDAMTHSGPTRTPMPRPTITVLLFCLLPAAALPPLQTLPTALHSVTAVYLEDAPGARPVAAIDAALIGAAADTRLRLQVRACGDQVVPVPGFDGVHGANLRTAEELHRLLREDQLRLVVRVNGSSQPGELLAVEYAPLPTRRLGADGTLTPNAITAGEWPVAVTFLSPPLSPGETWCYLLAEDSPRLAVQVIGIGGVGRIAAIESLAESGAAVGGGRR